VEAGARSQELGARSNTWEGGGCGGDLCISRREGERDASERAAQRIIGSDRDVLNGPIESGEHAEGGNVESALPIA
jgi:hypothetical protein